MRATLCQCHAVPRRAAPRRAAPRRDQRPTTPQTHDRRPTHPRPTTHDPGALSPPFYYARGRFASLVQKIRERIYYDQHVMAGEDPAGGSDANSRLVGRGGTKAKKGRKIRLNGFSRPLNELQRATWFLYPVSQSVSQSVTQSVTQSLS